MKPKAQNFTTTDPSACGVRDDSFFLASISYHTAITPPIPLILANELNDHES